MAKQRAKFYVVWQGREAGIYESWAACEAQVKGVAAKYKGFATRTEAEKARESLASAADSMQKEFEKLCENVLKYMNDLINMSQYYNATYNIDANNSVYTTDSNGCIVKK